MAQHNELGEKGEFLASEWLKKEGYHIIERNWRTGKLELDIIAHNGEKLVVVEVKARETGIFGDPAFAVTKKKQKQIIKAANKYVVENDIQDETRFDIISVIIPSKSEPILEHHKDAFYPLL